MQSYDYDKYNRTIPTNTILLIHSWAEKSERESSSSWQELLLVWQMQSYNYEKYNCTISTNTILLIQSWAAKKVRGNHHHLHCCSRSCSLYERLVDPQTTGGRPLTITPNTILLRQMQSYNYDKYNCTISTNTILLIQSWAAKKVRGNHHHLHCCSRSCSLYERLVDPQTTGGRPLTITPNTILLRQMQSYNYDKYNRTIGTNTILLLQTWAEGLDLSDGKIFTTMEWLMVFVKVPL